MVARKYPDPFGRLFYNMKKSALSGPKGSGQKLLDPDYVPRKIDYWLDIPLDPEWVNESWHPLALSIDRLECGGDYVKDNIVICCRLANVGRSRFNKDKFVDVIDYIRANL